MTGDIFPITRPVTADLHSAVLAALCELLADDDAIGPALRRKFPSGATAQTLFDASLIRRGDTSDAVVLAGQSLKLNPVELTALAVAASAERDPLVPTALRVFQGHDFGPWPSLATLARILTQIGQRTEYAVPDISRAFEIGILQRIGDRMPAAEERFGLSPIMLSALDIPSAEPGAHSLTISSDPPRAWTEAATKLAFRLDRRLCVVLRKGDKRDRRQFAAMLATAFGRVAISPPVDTRGFGAAATLAGWLPVEDIRTLAGRAVPIAALTFYQGPRIVLADREGGIEAGDWECCDIDLPDIPAPQRAALWKHALGDKKTADRHRDTRIGPARIGSVTARLLAVSGVSQTAEIRAALGEDYRSEMEPHAMLVPQDVDDGAFVAEENVQTDLELLLARCRYRATAINNPVPGVRALLSGPSGTGKTMAVSWLATTLGLPLFKLDLSSVVSKYIGETEENLARLLDSAEAGDMVLLMDEADSLFSSRTETKDSSDRFANNQTNFLLSRIETFEGIAILTSNGPERFDTAFARRLDQVIEIPLPAARERRRIWLAHLETDHGLTGSEINRLAGLVDLAGGHVRNIAHSARVLAATAVQPIRYGDVCRGVDLEYRKLGRTPPVGLQR